MTCVQHGLNSSVLPDRLLHTYETQVLSFSTGTAPPPPPPRGQDLEIGELRRRLKAEHSVRKACERWLKSELKSRVSAARQRAS
jgi:hypothetical protein